MNYEMIVANRDDALKGLEDFEKNEQMLHGMGFNSAQIDTMRREKQKAYIQAHDEFWEAFKFPLEIISIDDDIPAPGETVYVYDEINRDWTKAEISAHPIDGEARFVQGLHVLGSPNNYASFTRWTRLPILSPNIWEI